MFDERTPADSGPHPSCPLTDPAWLAELQRRAECRAGQTPASVDAELLDTARFVHELRIHRIELEMQNEALSAAHAELEADLARFVALGELGPVGYFTVARDGTITDLNLVAAGLLGLAHTNPGGRRLGAYLDGDSLPVFNDYLERLFIGSGRLVCELVVVAGAQAEAVTLHVEGQRDRVRPVCHLAAINVSERRRTEQALVAAKAEAERANKAKSRFLAAASHDLRQPLAALALYVDVLQKRLPQGFDLPVGSMKDCVASLSEMLDDLLDLSKFDAGVVTVVPQDFSLAAVLDRALAAHAPDAQAKGVMLRRAACDLAVRTDPMLLGRIVGNLVANAVRYTERGGVLIGCRRRHGKRWVEVWDSGVGIAPESREEIFDEFRQLGNEGRDRAGGSGLGLAIAARAAALLGLEIRVQSRPGRGSMFAVELPAGGDVPPAAPRPRPAAHVRIGVVEDNPAVRDALVFALRACGHAAIGAASSGELIAALGSRAPELVISDFRLGTQETGIEVVRTLRRVFGNTLAAIIFTGDTDPQVIRRIADAGIEIEHKPLDLEALQRRITALTRRA